MFVGYMLQVCFIANISVPYIVVIVYITYKQWHNQDSSLFSFSFSFTQMEIDNGEELTSDFLYDEVHPKQHAHKQNFAKPKGPAGKRGIRRMIRGPAEAETTSD